MPMDIHVIIEREKMINPADWQAEITRHGFELELDQGFDPMEYAGFLPCRYRGKEAGFSYALDPLDPETMDDDEARQVGVRDTLLTFTTHGSLEDLACSVIAAATLCAVTDGLIPEGAEEGEFIRAGAAIANARQQEATIREAMQAEASSGAVATGTRAVAITVEHGDGNASYDYLHNPRYHELRARQMAIFTDRKGALSDAEFAELDEIDRELKAIRGV